MLLLVEDDPMLGATIVECLSEDFQVQWVRTLGDARLAMELQTFDLLLFDVTLPDGSGLDLLRSSRETGVDTPILMLTALDAPAQRVEGLMAGADDYIGKPFDLNELIARCHAAIRRARGNPNPAVRIGRLTYDKAGHCVSMDGQPLPLSSRELRVFDTLFANVGRIVSKDQLEERLHHLTGDLESNAVEVYVSRLRRKIGHEMIQTLRGVGYMLKSSP